MKREKSNFKKILSINDLENKCQNLADKIIMNPEYISN